MTKRRNEDPPPPQKIWSPNETSRSSKVLSVCKAIKHLAHFQLLLFYVRIATLEFVGRFWLIIPILYNAYQLPRLCNAE
jgi:hypothetical protein